MNGWETWLTRQRDTRERLGLQRTLRPRGAHDDVIDLAGNDYLGLSKHPAVRSAAAEAAQTWGAGAGASRLVTGTTDLHGELEAELADYLGWPAALVFSTGYHANLAVVAALAERARVISDAHVHASLVDAARLARAEVTVTDHNDVAAVEAALASCASPEGAGGCGACGDGGCAGKPTRFERVVILVESIYSVLGDEAPLAELVRLAEQYDAMLVVDEAHGLGVRGDGRGLVHAAGFAGHPNVVVAATLSKSLGSQGGSVLGSPALIDHLVNRARPFIFDTGLAPAATAGALAALRILRDNPDLPASVTERVRGLADLLDVPAPAGALLSVPMTSPQEAVAAQAACLEAGVRVGCFRPPSVPDGISRLRITASAGVSDEDWSRAVKLLLEVIR
ncbi:8-amino-7-oxononanoate synthase [Nocardioides limicola]|uniref:8-amino-7-oxononanoate synthase n=1 Tax=Nocardioides limicola TaxID=2803368 RepID=UPI00193C85A8|nr:8-amino-7-oxononanoate synthase [Nocardioides sp. DJM-14]